MRALVDCEGADTMSVDDRRVVSADEARLLLAGEPGPCCERWDPQFGAPHCDFHPEPPRPDRTITATDLAHTVIVQAEQIAALEAKLERVAALPERFQNAMLDGSWWYGDLIVEALAGGESL